MNQRITLCDHSVRPAASGNGVGIAVNVVAHGSESFKIFTWMIRNINTGSFRTAGSGEDQTRTTMKEIKDYVTGGERPFFAEHDLLLDNVTVLAGESALKECRDIRAVNCRFEGKYPFWHVDRFYIEKCLFTEGARAALWYCRDLEMKDTQVDAPKMFREMDRMALERVNIPNALETMWHCRDIRIRDVVVDHADYIFMHCDNIDIDRYRQNGNYSFQYCRDVTVDHAEINSRDAFWMTENVTVRNSRLNGEYLGWHSKNLHLINCHISGTQPLCYCDNLIMENCSMDADCDLAFEESVLHADIRGAITSVKNPTSGVIKAESIGEIILDKNIKAPADCKIETIRK